MEQINNHHQLNITRKNFYFMVGSIAFAILLQPIFAILVIILLS